MNKDSIQPEEKTTAEKLARISRLQQEVDFLLRHVNDKKADTEVVEYTEDAIIVNEDGSITDTRINAGIEYVESAQSQTGILKPMRQEAVRVTHIMSDRVSETVAKTVTKKNIRKGMDHIVGPILYRIFRMMEE